MLSHVLCAWSAGVADRGGGALGVCQRDAPSPVPVPKVPGAAKNTLGTERQGRRAVTSRASIVGCGRGLGAGVLDQPE